MRLEQERCNERLERIENTLTKIQHTDWESRIAATLQLPYEEVLRQQAEILLSALCGGKTFAECVATLLDGDIPSIRYLVQQLPALKTLLETSHQPALGALLAWKDSIGIPDSRWSETTSLLRLGDYATISKIKKRREEVNKLMPAKTTASGNGSELPLLDFITWLIRQTPPKTKKIVLKFAFDGANITSKRRVTEEIGTIELLLDECNLEQLRSVTNCHQYIIYIGGESRKEYQAELANVIPVVNQLIKTGKLAVDGIEYDIEPVLVCDLKALVKLLGLYNCFHPKAYWKCPWCSVCIHNLADFGIKEWPLRTKEEWDKLATEAERRATKSAKDTFARNNKGIMGTPLFDFAMDHIIPCMLHCLMGVTRKLFELLAAEAHNNPTVEEEFLAILASLKISLIHSTSSEGKKRTFSDRVKGSRLGRPEQLRIIENHQQFIAVLERGARTQTQQAKVAKTKKVWELYHKLLSLAVQPEVVITKQQWLAEAIPFGRTFIARYTKSEVTPYIHIFIYHIGFFLEKYGSIEKFANYATESMHSVNKRTIANASSHFQRTTDNNICQQQLQTTWRRDNHNGISSSHPISKKRKHPHLDRRSWGARNLQLHQDMQKYVPTQLEKND